MDKFLSIPVTAGGNQLIPVTDVKLIEVGDAAAANAATATTLFYGNDTTIAITHATVGTPSASNSGTQFRNWLQEQMNLALSSSWTNPSLTSTPAYAVSAIAYA